MIDARPSHTILGEICLVARFTLMHTYECNMSEWEKQLHRAAGSVRSCYSPKCYAL